MYQKILSSQNMIGGVRSVTSVHLQTFKKQVLKRIK